ncbi:MAG: PD40 domain-containing protein [Saprospiraceae bacterium]|nr:PD40 domain-containing protein [Saprospiraceae bacterium]
MTLFSYSIQGTFICLAASLLLTSACKESGTTQEKEQVETVVDSLILPGENHFKSIRQVTFGGDNAEAYWSFNDEMLVFQARNPKWGTECDQIYVTGWQDSWQNEVPQIVSTGRGRTTCSYFMPGDTSVLYASTHHHDEQCPQEVERKPGGKYVWSIYPTFDIFISDLKGNITKQLTNTKGYDAEATVSPKGDKIIFTSDRSGDLELYTMNIDGSGLKQITSDLGYDGGAFFSPDGTKIVWRASRPTTPEDVKEYKELLKQGLVEPTDMEVFVANADGTNVVQVTKLGKANWCPFFHPSGEKIVFASNHASERGFPFNLYLINLDGSGLERITADDAFSAFPVFSNNGKYLAFSSNRNNGGTRDTNFFIAEWKD